MPSSVAALRGDSPAAAYRHLSACGGAEKGEENLVGDNDDRLLQIREGTSLDGRVQLVDPTMPTALPIAGPPLDLLGNLCPLAGAELLQQMKPHSPPLIVWGGGGGDREQG
jgi:hypothetical protein